MFQLFRKPEARDDTDYEALYRELRRTMQDIVIAHAAVAYKHMTTEQFVAVQAEWAQLIAGKGWAAFFSEDMPAPGARRDWAEE